MNSSRTSSTAAFEAATKGDVPRLKRLIAEGLNVNFVSDIGESLLETCCWNCNLTCARALVEMGADVNIVNRQRGGTSVLMSLAEHPDPHVVEIIRFLISQGAEIEWRDAEGHTALVDAVSHSNTQVVKALLELGANPNVVTSADETPLSYAMVWGPPELVEILIDAGADVNHQTHSGWTPLFFALDPSSFEDNENARTKVIHRLLEKGANPNHINGSSESILLYATKGLGEGIAIDLATKCNNLDHRDELGDTALRWATKRGFSRLKDVLKNRGATE